MPSNPLTIAIQQQPVHRQAKVLRGNLTPRGIRRRKRSCWGVLGEVECVGVARDVM